MQRHLSVSAVLKNRQLATLYAVMSTQQLRQDGSEGADHISDGGPSRPHGTEGGMAWRVQEGQRLLAVWHLHLKCTYMLHQQPEADEVGENIENTQVAQLTKCGPLSTTSKILNMSIAYIKMVAIYASSGKH